MSFQGSVINPILRATLRSPLHPVCSGALALLTVTGRTSGRTYTFPVQYARHGASVVVYPGDAERKSWWRNLRGGAPVRLRIAGHDRTGTGAVVEGDPAAVAEGLREWLARFPRAARSIDVPLRAEGTPAPDALVRLAEHAVVVRISLDPAPKAF